MMVINPHSLKQFYTLTWKEKLDDIFFPSQGKADFWREFQNRSFDYKAFVNFSAIR